MPVAERPIPRLSERSIGIGAAVVTALVPGLSALGAVMFLDEPLSWSLLVGLLLVTAGILFGVRRAAVPPQALRPPLAVRSCDV